ncbi:hypothetical protein AAG570_014140 [Ranatra chinensis]|uniref:Protein MIX23 n=1 Tax=Ranatra chinensis TaxID=642074 RepID=A0ABD0XRT5_9HEMI
MRDVDDKLVYALNVNVPTPSFRGGIDPTHNCETLYKQLRGNYEKRETAIKNCIGTVSTKVKQLREVKDSSGSGDLTVVKQLNKEQTKLRLLRSELNVEEVLQDRSMKLYYERCREFYKPPNPSSSQ